MVGPEGAWPAPSVDLKALHARISELTLENDFLRIIPSWSGPAERQAMIDRTLALALQAEALKLRRSTLYQTRAVPLADLAIVPLLDERRLDCRYRGVGCCAIC